jgi:hypothetical protein
VHQYNETVKPTMYAFHNMFTYDLTCFNLAILTDHSNTAEGSQDHYILKDVIFIFYFFSKVLLLYLYLYFVFQNVAGL